MLTLPGGSWFTLGPSSLPCARQILGAGANGVRLTFSYGTPRLQAERATEIRGLAQELGVPCTIVADLPGGKYRLGEFDGGDDVEVNDGQVLKLVVGKSSDPDAGVFAVPNRDFLAHLNPGDTVLVGDGGARLRVQAVEDDKADVVALGKGSLQETRGLTVESDTFAPPALTARDLDHLAFVAREPVFDAVAISFVGSAEDVAKARSVLERAGRSLPVVAKIEHGYGVQRATAIAEAADAVIVGRGDLALALPWVELPAAVSSIADACARARTPWIVATQIAEGLERFAMPTRAEICDLAHWLQQGAAGALLSYETAFGSNPVGAVEAVGHMLNRWGTERVPRD